MKEGEAKEIEGVGDTVKVEGIGKISLICETSEGEKTEVLLEEARCSMFSSHPQNSQQVSGQGSKAQQSGKHGESEHEGGNFLGG